MGRIATTFVLVIFAISATPMTAAQNVDSIRPPAQPDSQAVAAFVDAFIARSVAEKQIPGAASLPLLLLAAAVVLAGALAAPMRWIIRRVRRTGSPRGPDSRGVARVARITATAALWLMRLTLFGWLAYLPAQIVDPRTVAGMCPALAVLSALAMASAVAAPLIVFDSVLAWREPSRGFWNSAGTAITACAAVAVVWLFLAFDFASLGGH